MLPEEILDNVNGFEFSLRMEWHGAEEARPISIRIKRYALA